MGLYGAVFGFLRGRQCRSAEQRGDSGGVRGPIPHEPVVVLAGGVVGQRIGRHDVLLDGQQGQDGMDRAVCPREF